MTLIELRDAAQELLSSGVDPETPVWIRTMRAPCEPDTDPVITRAGNLWANIGTLGYVYLDEKGV